MEPAAGPGRGGVCPAPGGEGGTDPAQGSSSAAGTAPGAGGGWSGAAGGNWITAHPTVGLGVSEVPLSRPEPPHGSRGARGVPTGGFRGELPI